jgi:thiol:disulfide interchange protein
VKLDRRFLRQALVWIGLAALVYFGNVQLQSWMGRRALEETGLEIHSYEEGLALAARQGKPVLAGLSAIWCSSCRTFDQDVLGDDQVRRAIEDDYVFVRVEYGDDEGKAFRERYGVSGFPVFLVLEPDGDLVRPIPTTYDADEFLRALRRG